MDTPESPTKRLKCTIPTYTTWDVLHEPALLELIVRFLPSDTEAKVGETKQEIILTTIAALSRAFPIASRIVGPDNKTFWRSMVLKHFDFTHSASSFNPENEIDPDYFDLPNYEDAENDDDDEDDEDDVEREDTHLLIEELKAWTIENEGADFPDEFFDEDYLNWKSLGVWFRPSQYGFLEQIQHNPALVVTLWPEHEDPFTLFRDLVVIQKFVRPENESYTMTTQFEDPALPVLLRALDNDSVDKYAMLKNCGHPPHFAVIGDGLSQRWTGFDIPRPCLDVPDSAKGDSEYEPTSFDLATREEEGLFPGSSAIDFLKLRRLVYDLFDDWRNLHVAECSLMGTEFYFGRSKVSGRWLGFVGPTFYG